MSKRHSPLIFLIQDEKRGISVLNKTIVKEKINCFQLLPFLKSVSDAIIREFSEYLFIS